jgi:hypothetical protein
MKRALALSLLMTIGSCAALEAQSPSPTPATSAVGGTSQSPDQMRAEIALLRNEIDTIHRYEDQLLETVHWSLGTVATVAVLLIGLQWFSGARTSSRERAALRESVDARVRDELRTASAALDATVNKFQKEFSARLEDQGESTDRQLRDQLDSLEQRIRRDLNEQVSLDEIRYKVLALDLAKAEAEVWKLKGIPSNAAGRYMRYLELALELDRENSIAIALDEIKDLLTANPEAYSIFDKPRLSEMLPKVPDRFGAAADEVMALLRKSANEKAT